jgi:WD40 repeat protein
MKKKILESVSSSKNKETNGIFSKKNVFTDKKELLTKLNSKDIKPIEKLSFSINYLQNKTPSDYPMDSFVDESTKIMSILDKEFESDENYKPWVRYLDILNKVKSDYLAIEEAESFKKNISKIFSVKLSKNKENLDYRIAKKMLDIIDIKIEDNSMIGDFFENDITNSLINSIKYQIEKAKDILIYKEDSPNNEIAFNYLNKLDEIFNDESKTEQVKKSIKSGRLDKTKFDLPHTLIFGEDGGLYALLNRLDESEKKIIDSIMGEDYLKDKIVEAKFGTEKVVIGKGGFGTVKFGLSIFNDPGKVICIKKTKSYSEISEIDKMSFITENTMSDYFGSGVIKSIYVPKIFDMTIVSDKDAGHKHQKGYLMMEIFPQNTGTRVFSDPKYQKWEYQKPYMISLVQNIQNLAEENVVMTDLKPDNTLYNTDTRKTSIIDLGGTIKFNSKEEIYNFKLGSISYSYTKEFAPKELVPGYNEVASIDLTKASVYGIGMILEDITKNTDADRQKIEELVSELTKENPQNRLDIKNTLSRISQIGDDSYKEQVIYTDYIAKIKSILERDKESISINQDVEEAKQLFIELKSTSIDPYKYKNLKTEKLFTKIDNFFQNSTNKVFLLLGATGSGKSTTIQLKFIEAVNSWQAGDPIPIYFNLANTPKENSFYEMLSRLDKEIDTNLAGNMKGAHVYLDGSSIDSQKVNLVQKYLINSETKVIISCSSENFNDKDDEYFKAQDSILEKAFIAPINYIANKSFDQERIYQELMERVASEESSNQEEDERKSIENKHQEDKRFFDEDKEDLEERKSVENKSQEDDKKLLDDYFSGMFNFIKKYDIANYLGGIYSDNYMEQYIKKYISVFGSDYSLEQYRQKLEPLERFIDTPLNFRIIMNSGLMDIDHKSQAYFDIYSRYTEKYIQDNKPKGKKLESSKKNYKEYDDSFYDNLAKYIASELHLSSKNTIKDDSQLFKYLGYKKDTPLKYQKASVILKSLPLKVEVKKVNDKEEILLSFTSDVFKNFYLISAISEELESGKSSLLSSKSIVNNTQLLRLFTDTVTNNADMRNDLLRVVNNSKVDKSSEGVTAASNAITILVRAKHSFATEDLSNISIKGADISGGIFQFADLTDADLTDVNMTNSNFVGANMRNTIMQGVNFGIYPDLKTTNVYSIAFSNDDKYVLSGHKGFCNIWDYKKGEVICTFHTETQQEFITSCAFSSSGGFIVTGSSNGLVNLWINIGYIQVKEIGTIFHPGAIFSKFIGNNIVVTGSKKDYVNKKENGIAGVLNIANKEKGTIAHSTSADSYAISPDHKYIVAAGGNSLTIHELSTLKMISEIIVENDASGGKAQYTMRPAPESELDLGNQIFGINVNDEVSGASFSINNGKHVVATKIGIIIKIFDAFTGRFLSKIVTDFNSPTTTSGFEDMIMSMFSGGGGAAGIGIHSNINFSPNGDYIISGCKNSVKMFSVSNGDLAQEFIGHVDKVTNCIFSNDGNLIIISGSNNTKICDVSPKKFYQENVYHKHNIKNINFSECGKYMFSRSYDKTMKYDANTWEVIEEKDNNKKINIGITFSPDGKYIVMQENNGMLGGAKLVDIVTGETYRSFIGHMGAVMAVGFSLDGRYLATGGLDGIINIFDVMENSEYLNFFPEKDKKDMVRIISFSADNKYIVSGQNGGLAKIYDLSADKQILEIDTTNDGNEDVTRCIFSPDGKYIITGGEDGIIKVWDFSGNLVSEIGNRSLNDSIICISFSPDGNYVATSGGKKIIKIWEFATKKLVEEIVDNSDYIGSIVFSPDGKYLSTGSDDPAVRVYANKNYNGKNKWILHKELSKTESNIILKGLKTKDIVNLSDTYKKVFEQGEAIIDQSSFVKKQMNIYDRYDDNMIRYRSNLEKHLSSEMLDNLISTRNQLLIDIVTKIEQDNMKRFSINNSYVFISEQDLSNNQLEQQIREQQEESNRCCKCQIFRIDKIVYDNPILNNKDLFKRLSDKFGFSSALDRSSQFSEEGMNHIIEYAIANNSLEELLGFSNDYY